MELVLAIATVLGGIAAVWYFWDKWAERNFATARRLDSQSQTPHEPVSYPILAARRG